MDVAATQLEFTDGVCSPDSQAPHRSRRAWWTRSLAQILCRPLSGLLQLWTTRGPRWRGLISARTASISQRSRWRAAGCRLDNDGRPGDW